MEIVSKERTIEKEEDKGKKYEKAEEKWYPINDIALSPFIILGTNSASFSVVFVCARGTEKSFITENLW